MTPRKASLRVAHSSSCANASKTAIDSTGKGSGCTCVPSFYVAWRDTSGATRKSARVRDRRVAEQMRTAQQKEIDEGRAGVKKEKNMAFTEWADVYLALPETQRRKGATQRTYAASLEVAKDVFGYTNVRDIGQAELRQFDKRFAHTSDATRAKHLRHLSACLAAAVDEKLATENPIKSFRKKLGLESAKGTPPFTDGEVERMLAELAKEKESVYLYVIRAQLATGARVGELIALRWEDVNLGEGTVEIRHTYNPVDGVIAPKDKDARTVYLTDEGQKVFADWLAVVGAKADGLVFVAPRGGGYLNADYLRKVVHSAMDDAGVPVEDARTKRPRRPTHSFRATCVRRWLENGRHPQWVEAQVGHSDLALTMHVYGAWGEDAMKAEATR